MRGEWIKNVGDSPFGALRSFAFNILKANQTATLNQDRYRAALAGVDNLIILISLP